MKSQDISITVIFLGKLERFRSVLEIKKRTSTLEIPQFLVVMMNPGSSTPIDLSIDIQSWDLKGVKRR